MNFEPDYRHFESVMQNKRPARLPLYEHLIKTTVMEQVLDTKFSDLLGGSPTDKKEFFRHYCLFFKEMTYDTVRGGSF